MYWFSDDFILLISLSNDRSRGCFHCGDDFGRYLRATGIQTKTKFACKNAPFLQLIELHAKMCKSNVFSVTNYSGENEKKKKKKTIDSYVIVFRAVASNLQTINAGQSKIGVSRTGVVEEIKAKTAWMEWWAKKKKKTFYVSTVDTMQSAQRERRQRRRGADTKSNRKNRINYTWAHLISGYDLAAVVLLHGSLPIKRKRGEKVPQS